MILSINNQCSAHLPILKKGITILFELISVSGTFSVTIPELRLLKFITILVVPFPVTVVVLAVVRFWTEGSAPLSAGHLDRTIVVALAVGLAAFNDLIEFSYVVLVAGDVAAKACCCCC